MYTWKFKFDESFKDPGAIHAIGRSCFATTLCTDQKYIFDRKVVILRVQTNLLQ